ncbi:MAG: CPBP family intramembrane metalloprotease [Oscillospiraceae bacterium]|nr:CPBP family intramembrane metalloprotease [Oscillospiraceae bacterium]
MKMLRENDYATFPITFGTYRWYKPLIVGALFVVFWLISSLVIDLVTKLLFHTTVTNTGYDDMDFFTAAGAFDNAALAAVVIPCLILAALIVRDRPVSSYFSSMGGWRWGVFLKTLAAAFVILGIPTIVWLLIHGRTGEMAFTLGGFILLTLLAPLQGIGEELLCRGFIMQTVSSWFKLPIVGVIVQTIIFAVGHPYNAIGMIEIVISGLLYALICLRTKGIESSSALHIVNNMTAIYMAGFGFGSITSEATVPDDVVNVLFKILFFVFIIYADRKLHWFDKVK